MSLQLEAELIFLQVAERVESRKPRLVRNEALLRHLRELQYRIQEWAG